MKLRPKLTKLIKERSGCSDESYWKEFEPTFATEVKNNCPNPCSSRGLPYATLELCQTYTDWKCADNEFETNLVQTKAHQYSSCNKLEYKGRIVIIDHPNVVIHQNVTENSFVSSSICTYICIYYTWLRKCLHP